MHSLLEALWVKDLLQSSLRLLAKFIPFLLQDWGTQMFAQYELVMRETAFSSRDQIWFLEAAHRALLYGLPNKATYLTNGCLLEQQREFLVQVC